MEKLRSFVLCDWLVLGIFLVAGGISLAEEEVRVWTDTKGRKIEAKLFDIGINKISVMKDGKLVEIPLHLLSEADRKYVEDIQQNGFSKDASGGGRDQDPGEDKEVVEPVTGLTFAGKELKAGGTVNVYDFDYDEQLRADLVKKFNAEDTGYKIGVAVPADFDPSKPQKVCVIMSPGNNAGQMTAGNIRSLGQFAKRGTDEGWVCIAYNSILGLPDKHYGGYEEAVKKIKEIWPGISGWKIATGGISGGAKGALINLNLLISMDLPVQGVFLQGCNDPSNLATSSQTFKVKKGDLRGIRCFISTGTKDPLVSAAAVERVKAGVKDGGIKDIRDERYEGGHDLNLDQFAMALEWFEQAAP